MGYENVTITTGYNIAMSYICPDENKKLAWGAVPPIPPTALVYVMSCNPKFRTKNSKRCTGGETPWLATE